MQTLEHRRARKRISQAKYRETSKGQVTQGLYDHNIFGRKRLDNMRHRIKVKESR